MNQPTPASPDGGRETRTVDIRGRSIMVRQLVDAQMLFLAREAKLMARPDTPGERRVTGMMRIFDALESQVIDEGDREYLLDLVSKGGLELKELMTFVTSFTEEEVEQPKVRRGRRPAISK